VSTSSLYESVLAVVGANPALAATRPPRASASVVLWRWRQFRLAAYGAALCLAAWSVSGLVGAA